MKKVVSLLALASLKLNALYGQIDGGLSERPEGTDKYIVAILSLLILAVFVWILKRQDFDIIRDGGVMKAKKAPYSLSRSQMAWWTFIVLFSFLYIWFTQGEMIAITQEMLLLLGISAGTTVTANFIDSKDIEDKNLKRHQDTEGGKFFLNIISDQKGPSIHRFQNAIFSLAVGVFVLHKVISTQDFPDLDTNIMVLMGISSGTYVAIKNGENKTFQAEEERNS